MNAVDLQDRLACLVCAEMLLLPAAEIERAFPFYPGPEARREAVVDLAWLYRCDECGSALRGPFEVCAYPSPRGMRSM